MSNYDTQVGHIQEALAKAVGGKASLALQKFTALGEGCYRLIATVPSLNYSDEQLSEAVLSSFGQRFRLVEGSVRIAESRPNNLATLIVVPNTVSREFSEKATSGMKVVATNVFMDNSDNSIWKVCGEGEERRLVMSTEDNLDAILESRKSRFIQTAGLDVDFDITPQTGDYVGYFNPRSQVISFGYAANSNGDHFILDRMTGKIVKIVPALVVDAVEAASLEDMNPLKAKEVQDVLASQGGSNADVGLPTGEGSKLLDYYRKLYKNTTFFSKLEEMIGKGTNNPTGSTHLIAP